MMRLKYLFDNKDLAEMMLKNWEHDDDYMEMFKYFRISSNAVYPFKNRGNMNFLRISPVEEKAADSILAELKFIDYLRSKDYPAVERVKTRNDRELITADTPWGEYIAVVFKGVKGEQLSNLDLGDDIVYAYGRSLGELHQHSSNFHPVKYRRWTYKDVLGWISDVLGKFPDEKAALKELEILKEYLEELPVTNENYGLIHYDFECDNVFYDQNSKSCNIIDFDDAMYHWYLMDIVQALESIKEEVTQEDYIQRENSFLEGYRSQYDITDDMFSRIVVFHRFKNLYGYTRIIRSVEEKWHNEPEWMEGLRGHLTNLMEERSQYFGTDVDLST